MWSDVCYYALVSCKHCFWINQIQNNTRVAILYEGKDKDLKGFIDPLCKLRPSSQLPPSQRCFLKKRFGLPTSERICKSVDREKYRHPLISLEPNADLHFKKEKNLYMRQPSLPNQEANFFFKADLMIYPSKQQMAQNLITNVT